MQQQKLCDCRLQLPLPIVLQLLREL